jgi:DNA polymerase I-like protein with 3'-5' exonuclease and polymerase domains
MNIDELLNELESDILRPKRKREPLPDKFTRVEPFNPDSPDQIQELCKHLGVKLPRRRGSDDEDALSTEKKFLLRASRRYPVLRMVLDCKERWKLLSTYNWKLDSDSRVHTTLGWHTSSWRKSSRDYNLQNIPKRSSLAAEFRRMVVAPPGHVILEGDSSAIEAVLVGYFARSERYIRLAKSGIHDFFNALVHGEHILLDQSEDALRAACRAAKSRYDKASREVAKRVVHLTAYRGTPERMCEEYPDDFATVATARRLQNQFLDSEPGQDLQRWWRGLLERVGKEKYLCNPFGGRHRFFHIFTYNKRRQCFEANGDDAKRAIAYLPQSSASAIQDIYVQALWQTPLRDWLCMVIHDSCLAYVPVERAAEAAATMRAIMEAPIPELGGLAIGAEISMSAPGGNWAEMEVVDAR